ncbi:hypothetical protein NQ317_008817 [Molorchus minor]|uniref:Uncharacterized protein n=1 Tax=Molorchus minor TaxID=1323400 RepID=A0ABQ9JVI7_9CUCU|nr:hypothetical protein NQ317_008817 [Molorchus minor]
MMIVSTSRWRSAIQVKGSSSSTADRELPCRARRPIESQPTRSGLRDNFSKFIPLTGGGVQGGTCRITSAYA